MKISIKCLVVIMVLMFTLMGCYKTTPLYEKTIQHTINDTNKAIISFESKYELLRKWGVYFISGDGIPTPEAGTTYSSIEIPVNKGKTIKVRAWSRETILGKDKQTGNMDFTNVDKQFNFEIPPLQAGLYTISYLFNVGGMKNKNISLIDSSGNKIAELKFEWNDPEN